MNVRPSLITPALLDVVPSNTYRSTFNSYRPVNPPQNGVQYSADQESNLIYQISCAPNEYADMTGAYFAVNVRKTIRAGVSGTPYNGAGAVGLLIGEASDVNRQIEKAFVSNAVLGRKESKHGSAHWRWGPWPIGRSSESVNSSLSLDENNDSTLAPVYNNLRCMLAKRDYDPVDDAVAGLEGAGCSFMKQRQGLDIVYSGANLLNDGTVSVGDVAIRNGVSQFRIPLQLISEIARCPSLVPLGFFSSVAVNAYRINVTLPRMSSTGPSPVLYLPPPGAESENINPSLLPITEITGVDAFTAGDGYYTPQVVFPTTLNLSANLQEETNALYTKTATQKLGDFEVPVSLRLNSLGFRLFGNIPLRQGQAMQHFNLPDSDQSVRSIGFIIFNTKNFERHYADDGTFVVPNPYNGQLPTLSGNAYSVNHQAKQLRITEMRVRIGNEDVAKGCPRDYRSEDGNLATWLSLQERRSGGCFSAFPYWKEFANPLGEQSDFRKQGQWGVPSSRGEYNTVKDTTTIRNALTAIGCYNAQYGVISLENSNHDGMDFDDVTRATGVSLNGVGAINVEMGLSHEDSEAVNGLSPGPDHGDYRIIFMMPYDTVTEVSPAGMFRIQQEVLAY